MPLAARALWLKTHPLPAISERTRIDEPLTTARRWEAAAQAGAQMNKRTQLRKYLSIHSCLWPENALTAAIADKERRNSSDPRNVRQSKREFMDRIDHFLLLNLGEPIVKRQSQKAIADIFGHGTIAGPSAELSAHVRQMQWKIMKHAENAARFEMRNQQRAGFQRRQQQVI